MKPIKIGPTETKLLKAIEAGETADLEGATIRAEFIRRIVLGLPFDEEASIWREVRRLFGRPSAACGCARTPVGISIKDAVIDERLNLAAATGEEGGPMCPLSFENCRFEGPFSGAHARFSRLSFNGCCFVNAAEPGLADIPSIELSGASIDSDLHMAGIHPHGIKADSDLAREQGNYLWIRLNGARIDGEIDLCGSHLRAPPSPPRLTSEDANDALDLTLAEIRGDIQLLAARSEGRIKIRTGHVAGDIWMTAATIENPGDQAILIQGSRVEGFLMMDGGFGKSDRTGPFRKFKCWGRLKLEATDVGRSLYLEDAVVRGPIEAPLLTVRDDLILHAEVSGPIDLTGCRIGGSLELSKLNLASTVGKVSLKDGNVGRSLALAQPDVCYEFVKARRMRLEALPPLQLVETLWRLVPGGKDERDEKVPLRRRLVQAAFLIDDTAAGDVRIFHLDGHADVIGRAIKRRKSRKMTRPAIVEAKRLRDAYVLRPRGSPGLEVDSPWFENGLILVPQLPPAKLRSRIAKDDWIAAPMGELEPYTPSRQTKESFGHHIESNPLLQACFDLEGLTCDMLGDRAGRAWGEHLDRIRMNHFVYRRSDWGGEARGTFGREAVWRRVRRWLRRRGDWLKAPLLGADGSAPGAHPEGFGRDWLRMAWRNRPSVRGYDDDRVDTRVHKSSSRWLWGRLRGVMADWLWPRKRGRTAAGLREESDYLEPWQLRRNWIYRQFTPLPVQNLVSISRYRPSEQEYRSQPFEQAILVARAEGREEFAVHFEMLKRRIEWRLFNRRSRWPLAGIGIACGALWLWYQHGLPVPLAVGVVATWLMMAFVSSIHISLKRIPWLWVRRLVREIILYIPALVLLRFFGNWWSYPFDFIIAFFVYLGIRFISVLSHAFMRFGFGYLRRPIRAVLTLITAFLMGWWGVSLANQHDMLVIDAEPVAQVAGADKNAEFPYYPLDKDNKRRIPILMGSSERERGREFYRELSCAPTISEPLYALDILVPLVDLHEESRCEVRRLPGHEIEIPPKAGGTRIGGFLGDLLGCGQAARSKAGKKPVSQMRSCELLLKFPDFIVADHRFWWWMKALYAIAGWFIVSLALLTFAQVNRTHGEPAEGD